MSARKDTKSAKASTGDAQAIPGSVAKSSRYIPASYLANLKKYKYSGADFSIMSRYVLQSYWNFVVGLVPMTVAPNKITFTGFVIGISSTFILLYYYFLESAVYPPWVWYYTAFSLFAYQTLDAIDGKQARRTGSGSPLGELFDHGCDAFLTPFVQLNTALAVGMPPWMTYGYMLQSSVGLFTAIWEQFSTGTFDLGYVSGPTEGILLVCGLYIVSGRYGTEVFDRPLAGPYDLTIPSNAFLKLFTPDAVNIHLQSARSFLMVFWTIPWTITVVTNVAHALFRPTVHRSHAVPVLAALPIAVITAMSVLVYAAYPQVHDHFPFVFELSLALLVSYTVTRLTLSRLCVMPYRPMNLYYCVTFLAYAIMLLLRHTDLVSVSEGHLSLGVGLTMTFLTAMGAFAYGRMVVIVFRQIAAFLNIRIMSIKPPKQA